jgi:hypothetical protein
MLCVFVHRPAACCIKHCAAHTHTALPTPRLANCHAHTPRTHDRCTPARLAAGRLGLCHSCCSASGDNAAVPAAAQQQLHPRIARACSCEHAQAARSLCDTGAPPCLALHRNLAPFSSTGTCARRVGVCGAPLARCLRAERDMHPALVCPAIASRLALCCCPALDSKLPAAPDRRWVGKRTPTPVAPGNGLPPQPPPPPPPPEKKHHQTHTQPRRSHARMPGAAPGHLKTRCARGQQRSLRRAPTTAQAAAASGKHHNGTTSCAEGRRLVDAAQADRAIAGDKAFLAQGWCTGDTAGHARGQAMPGHGWWQLQTSLC